jgi:hypothetical protein
MIKLSRSQRILGSKVPNSGHFEELSILRPNLCGKTDEVFLFYVAL